MRTLVFATNNKNKVDEIRHVLNDQFTIKSLLEANIDIDIPEPYNTLEENASTKSLTIWKMTGQDCFSEDSGLEVDALQGEPGVKSARYAGDGKDPLDNINLLLSNLKNETNRKARFRTVISLRLNGDEYLFEGICKGTITYEIQGTKGFGYDPVFVPEGSNCTFAEMSIDQKNIFSHRKIATTQLIAFLSSFGK